MMKANELGQEREIVCLMVRKALLLKGERVCNHLYFEKFLHEKLVLWCLKYVLLCRNFLDLSTMD